jgi:hypothetical protein
MTMKGAEGGDKHKATKMICPDCGDEMNFHAEKINQSARADSESDASAEFGGVVEEIHTCPRCAAIATRRAD